MKKFKNNKIAGFSTIMIIVAFVVCAASVSTAHAFEMSKQNSSHSHHGMTDNQQHSDGMSGHLSEHHLLSQPNQINLLNIILPQALNDEVVEKSLFESNSNKTEIINNQGAPPLSEPLKTGIVNTKSW